MWFQVIALFFAIIFTVFFVYNLLKPQEKAGDYLTEGVVSEDSSSSDDDISPFKPKKAPKTAKRKGGKSD